MKLRDLLLSLSLCLSACATDAERDFVPIPDVGFEVLFVLGFDTEGQIIEVKGPVVFDAASEGLRTTMLASEPAELLFVGWTHQALMDAIPLYDRSRIASSMLRVETTAACESGQVEHGTDPSFVTGLPETTIAVALVPGQAMTSAAVPTGLRLQLPADLESCVRENQRVLRPFAATEFPIPADAVVDGVPLVVDGQLLNAVRMLKDGRVLVLSGSWLLLLEQGQPLQLDASHALHLPGFAPNALDLDEDASRQPQGTLATIVSSNPGGILGEVIDVRVSEQGLELLAREPVNARLDDVVIRPLDGQMVAVSGTGSVVHRERLGGPSTLVDDAWADTGNNAVVGLTGDPDRPYVAGGFGRGSVMLGDQTGLRWTPSPVEGLDVSARVRAVSRVPEGSRTVWAGTSAGQLFVWQMDNASWEHVPVGLPPSFAPCGTRIDCGFFGATTTIRSVIPHSRGGVERAFLSVSACVGLIDTRRDGRCAGLLRVGERAPDDFIIHPVLQEPMDFRSIDLVGDRLVLGSQEGGVYVLDLAE